MSAPLPFDAAALAMSDDERRIISSFFMSAERRAAIAAERGERAAADAEAAHNTTVAETALPEVRRGLAEGVARGAQAERERCSAVVNSPEANGRRAAAIVLATQTELPPEVARQVLTTLPIV